MTRQRINLETKLAAALLTMVRPNADGVLEPIISHEHAQKLSASQIISLFHFDHYPIPHSQDGPDEPWNLRPLLIPEHREVTARVDIPQIAKTKRLAGAHQQFIEKAVNRKCGAKRDKSGRIRSRGFTKRPPQRSASRYVENQMEDIEA